MAQTNVQAFSGDVAISSNLAVSGSKFTYDNTNTTVFTGTTDAGANEIGYLDMSTSSSTNNIHVKIYIKYGNGIYMGDAEYSFYIRPSGAISSFIYDYRNQGGSITPVVYRTNATNLHSGGTAGVVRFGYISNPQNVFWRAEVSQRSNNTTFYPTNTGSAVVTTDLVQVTPAPFTRFDSNVAVNTNTLFVDSVGNKVGIGTTNPGSALDVVGTVTATGNVGIGTANPQQKLEVHGNILLGQNDIDSFIHGGSSLAMSSDHDVLIVSDANDTSDAAGADIIFGSGSAIDMNLNRNFTFAQAYPSGVPRLEHMRITGSGKVGIGTDSPTSNLHVVGDVAISSNLAVDTNTLFVDSVGNKVGIGMTNPLTPLHILSTNEITTSPASSGVSQLRYGTANSTMLFGVSSTAGHISAYDTSNFSTNRKLCLNADGGNVGIGTTNPATYLHLSAKNSDPGVTEGDGIGTHTLTEYLRFTSTVDGGDINNVSVGFKLGADDNSTVSPDGRLDICANDGSGAGNSYGSVPDKTIATFLGSGNVGIGTTNPTGNLQITSDLANADDPINPVAQLVLHSSLTGLDDVGDIGASLVFTQRWSDGDPNSQGTMGSIHGFKDNTAGNYGGGLLFKTQPAGDIPPVARMVIDRDGNVGIGTANPVIQLDVHGTNAKIGRALSGTTIHDADRRDSVYIGRWDDATLSLGFSGMRCRVDTDTALGYGSASNQTEIGLYAWGNSVANSRQVFAINAYGDGNMIGTLTQSGTGTTSDDRIKYNEEDVKSPLNLISQLNPQKYEKIVSVAVSEKEGIWIPTDEEWESVRSEYTYVDEFGFIAQDVRAIPELSFLVDGEETRTDTKTSTPEEYSNLTTGEQVTYTPSYTYESNIITQQEYSNLTPGEQEVYTIQYTKQIETQTPLSLNYNGLFVLAVGAIKELKAKNETLEARITALENA